MKIWAATLATAAVLAGAACTSPAPEADRSSSPRLVVLLVLDQMRADRLLDSSPAPGSGRDRLLSEGAIFENVHHAHALTWTAAGHATLLTGVHPSRHGVIGNSWWERNERAHVGAATDPGTRRLDNPELTGASGFRVRVSTLGDWLKQSSPDSRVWAVSLKDRTSAIVAGERSDGAFWYDTNSGRFVTSDHYLEAEPPWVVEFDESRAVEEFRGGWDLLDDPASYSRPDDRDGERPPTTFPHVFAEDDAYYTEIYNSVFGDELTFRFVRELIDAEGLGRDEATDLLIVGASSGDRVGHRFGPWSRETEDYDRRLDPLLNAFFDDLDRAAGADGWFLVVTSDHGVLPLPEQLEGAMRVAGRPLLESTGAILSDALESLGLDPRSVRLDYANGLVLDADREVPAEKLVELRTRLAAHLREHPRIEDVFTWDELASDAPLDRPYEVEYRRSFDPERSADLMIRLREFDLFTNGTTGTNHGSVYAYDTHVPLVLLGAGVEATRIDTPVWTVDLAPTLARCLGLETPGDLDGEIRFDCPW